MPGLTVSRYQGERVRIGDGDRAIWVTIAGVRGAKVSLNVVAPRDVSVQREENVPECER